MKSAKCWISEIQCCETVQCPFVFYCFYKFYYSGIIGRLYLLICTKCLYMYLIVITQYCVKMITVFDLCSNHAPTWHNKNNVYNIENIYINKVSSLVIYNKLERPCIRKGAS